MRLLKIMAAAAVMLATTSHNRVTTASVYSPALHGRRTASGELYNHHAHTAAHKHIKFGSLVRVTNLQNGISVIVRVNDRGPFVRGRDLDLSGAAYTKLTKGAAPGLVRVAYGVVGDNK